MTAGGGGGAGGGVSSQWAADPTRSCGRCKAELGRIINRGAVCRYRGTGVMIMWFSVHSVSVLQGVQCAGVQELPRVQRAVRPRVAVPSLQQKQVSAHPPAAAAAVPPNVE